MLKTIFILPDGTELSSGAGTMNAIQSVTITECVNGAQDLTLGSVCANMIEAKIITPEGGLSIAAGDEISVYKEDFIGNRHLVGIFVTEKPTRDKANRLNVTAYDRIIQLDKDLTNWLKDMGQEVSLLDFAKHVCAQCGLQLVNTELPNGGYIVPSFTKAGVTGRQLMKWIGEACGRFCRATADGNIEFAWYTPVDMTIGPHEIATASLAVDGDGSVVIDSRSVSVVDDGKGNVDITSEALSISEGEQGNAILTAQEESHQCPYFQGSFSYEDYQVAPVDAVQLRMADGQDGWLWPEAAEGANAYVISGNPILNRAIEDMLPVVQTILDQISGVTYNPCKIAIPSELNLHAGNIVRIVDRNGKAATAYIMTKTQTGQKDTLECTGNHRRDSSTAKNNKTVDQIAQEKVDAQTQSDIFYKLTDGGKLKGVYMKNGELYINASYLATGILASRDGESFFLDLENNILKAAFNELTVLGKSVTEIAQESVDVGGANMLKSSGFSYISPWWGANDTGLSVQTVDSKQCMRIDGTTTAEGVGRSLAVQGIGTIAPGSYIFTGSVHAEAATALTVGLWDLNFGGIAEETIALNAGWNKVQISFSVKRETEVQFGIGISRGSIACVHHPKLERGTVATDYSPAAGEATQEQVFASLTNNGAVQGFYIQDGKLYINGEYAELLNLTAESIKSGILKSLDGKIRIDLSGGTVPTFSSGISTNGITVRGDVAGVSEVFTAEAKKNALHPHPFFDMEIKSASDGKTIARLAESFKDDYTTRSGAQFFVQTADGHHQVNMAVTEDIAGVVFFCNGRQIGYVSIMHDNFGNPALAIWSDRLYINNKKVEWSDNGNGTYSLIGI